MLRLRSAHSETPPVAGVPAQRRRRHAAGDDGRRVWGLRPVTVVGLIATLAVISIVLTVTAIRVVGRSGPDLSPRPPLPADASSVPLARPATAPAGRGGFRFLGVQDDASGRPVRWDPCRPIHWVLRADGAPPQGEAAVRTAIARIEQLTGFRFVYDGVTAEAPRPERPAMDPRRYGWRWSPVLVAWTDPDEYSEMSGYAGLAGPNPVAGDERGTQRYVSGVVLLNRKYLGDLIDWPDGRRRMDAVVTHEFGHLAGLDHVDDPHELMFRRPTDAGELGDGDRRGLAALSGGPCFRDF